MSNLQGKFTLDERYLITTNGWFLAPNGQSYQAVFGTVHALHSDRDMLGIETNRHSTNWYVEIGGMLVAGCQIFFCIKTDTISNAFYKRCVEHEGKVNVVCEEASRIYCADD